MNPDALLKFSIEPAMLLLQENYDSPQARAMLIAIALQESGLRHRRQIGGGPARGWWQFEHIGVTGVHLHPATQHKAGVVRSVLKYDADEVYCAIEHNDVLAAAYARLLLWRYPAELPTTAADGWRQYKVLWSPGKPKPDTWEGHWNTAVEAVGEL